MKKLIKPFAATDLCIFRFLEGELYVYLVKLKHSYYKGQWSLPGGLVRSEENLNQAARRVYHEATSKNEAIFEQFYTFSDPHRDPRTRSISTAYLVLPKGKISNFQPCDKYQDGQWVKVQGLKELAYDHMKILSKALKTITSKLHFTNLAFFVLSEKFTLSELQELYEWFLKSRLDKRNFRKKILSYGLLQDTKEMLTGLRARPAKLYSSIGREIKTLSMFVES